MSDYKKLLNALTLTNIKALVRTYISHVKFTVAKKTKDELIEHIMKHTDYVGGKVVSKPITFDMVKNKEKVVKEKKEKKETKKQEMKEDMKPKKIIKAKKETKKDEVKERVADPNFDENFALKKAPPKMTKEEYAKQAKEEELRKRNDPLTVMFSKDLIKNVDKFKDFKTGNKNDDFLVTYVIELIKNGKDFYHTYDKKESDDVRKVVDKMMKHIDGRQQSEIKEMETEPVKYKLTFLEYIEPNDNKDDDNLLSVARRNILDKYGDELDNLIDVDKYKNIIEDIPNLDDILYKILKWLERKQGKEKKGLITEYRTFVKSVVYNMFLKNVLNKMKVDTFDGIVISNIIASDLIFNQYYDNNTKYSIIRTFIEMKPFIPQRELKGNLKKIHDEYIMYGQKNIN